MKPTASRTAGFDQCRGYQQFRLALGCTPFTCLGVAPAAGIEAMRRAYRSRSAAAKASGADDEHRTIQLAWAVIRDLHDSGLVK